MHPYPTTAVTCIIFFCLPSVLLMLQPLLYGLCWWYSRALNALLIHYWCIPSSAARNILTELLSRETAYADYSLTILTQYNPQSTPDLSVYHVYIWEVAWLLDKHLIIECAGLYPVNPVLAIYLCDCARDVAQSQLTSLHQCILLWCKSNLKATMLLKCH